MVSDAPSPQEEAVGQQSRRTARALVIGEREITRHIASTLIEESGYHVIEAVDFLQATALLARHAQKLRLVFAEAASGEEAQELAHQISRDWPWIRVLVSFDPACMRDTELPVGAARLRQPWYPLDLLIEAERAMH
ncbi:MAG: response regulator receiver protein [Hyphomicrobiales bacterium]|nr:response regulator receiver protein [Hyphomicrobiales bacterium]